MTASRLPGTTTAGVCPVVTSAQFVGAFQSALNVPIHENVAESDIVSVSGNLL
jgi:hypothetical protein